LTALPLQIDQAQSFGGISGETLDSINAENGLKLSFWRNIRAQVGPMKYPKPSNDGFFLFRINYLRAV
jgi:hypothetical protein